MAEEFNPVPLAVIHMVEQLEKFQEKWLPLARQIESESPVARDPGPTAGGMQQGGLWHDLIALTALRDQMRQAADRG